MEIWRAIFLDSINELDKSNFGCHWTKDDLYYLSMEFTYHDISEKNRKGKNLYLFQTSVSENQIDKKATQKSNYKSKIIKAFLLGFGVFCMHTAQAQYYDNQTDVSVMYKQESLDSLTDQVLKLIEEENKSLETTFLIVDYCVKVKEVSKEMIKRGLYEQQGLTLKQLEAKIKVADETLTFVVLTKKFESVFD